MIPLGGAETKSIRIVAREFNNPEFVILDEVSNEQSEGDNWTVPNVTSGTPAGRGPQDGGGRFVPCDGPECDGCTDPFACNYDENAVNNDGSCLYPTDPCYYLQFPDPSDCVPVYYGCSDPDACNYDPLANAPGKCGVLWGG